MSSWRWLKSKFLRQADAITGNTRILFADPFNPVAGQLAQCLQIFAATGVIGQEVDQRAAGQVTGAFFKA